LSDGSVFIGAGAVRCFDDERTGSVIKRGMFLNIDGCEKQEKMLEVLTNLDGRKKNGSSCSRKKELER